MNHILLLEGDSLQAQALVETLHSSTYQVEWARSLHETWYYLKKKAYDALIISREAEDGDGLEIIRYVHTHAYQTKMMMLSSCNQIEKRVESLQAGADDYLAKPFSLTELLLRLEKLLNRTKLYKAQEVKLGSLTFYPEQGYLFRHGNYQVLRRREATVLHCLCLHANQVLSRQQIASWAWQNHELEPTNKSVDTYMKRLREAFGQEKELIETVRGFGYRLNCS